MGRLPKRIIRRNAADSVGRLIAISIKVAPDDEALAANYIRKALRLCERYRIRKPLLLRRLFCRKCKNPIFPGKTSRFRIRRGRVRHLSIMCLICGSIARIPLNRKENGTPDRS
ncbi:MAG: hypothetical protein ACUVTL_00410 [Thermoproteota archaeon]